MVSAIPVDIEADGALNEPKRRINGTHFKHGTLLSAVKPMGTSEYLRFSDGDKKPVNL
jgi:hypothetical protein